MKKLLYVLLAMTVAFAMMGCPTDGGDGPGETKYKVTFDLNGGTGDQPPAITVGKGKAIGALPDAPTLTGKLFDGWTVSGTEITATYAVTKDIIVTAAWFDPGEEIIKVKSYNSTGVTAGEIEITFSDTKWNTIKTNAAFARPKWSNAVTGDAYEFAGWYDVTGTLNDGKKLDNWDSEGTLESGTIIEAKWASTALNAPDATLKMALENGGYILFEFTLPEGKTAADYESVTAQFMVPESSLNKQIRSFRLMGPYSETTFNGNTGNKTTDEGNGFVYTGDFTTDPNGLMVAKYDTENASAIAHDNGYGWSYDWAGLQGKDEAVANTWFAAAYPFGGASASPNTAFTAARLQLTGKVYFGVGISGTQAAYNRDSNSGKNRAVTDYYNAIVQAVKDVKLVGKTGTNDIVGIPAVKNGKAVVAGYLDAIFFSWSGSPSAAVTAPTPPPYDCACDPKSHVDPCTCGASNCTCTVLTCTDTGCAMFGLTKAQALAQEKYCDCDYHDDDDDGCCPVCLAVGTGPVTETEISNPTASMYGTIGFKADGTGTYNDEDAVVKVLTLGADGFSWTVGELDFNSGSGGKTGYVAEANPFKDLSGDALKAAVEAELGVKFFDADDYDTTSETIDSEEENPYFELTGDALKAAAEENDPDYDEDTYDADNYDTTNKFVQIANPYKGLTGDALKTAVEEALDITFEDDPFDASDYDTTNANIIINKTLQGKWGGGGVWYELPENYKSYTTIKVEYTATPTAANVAAGNSEFFVSSTGTAVAVSYVNPQVTVKKGRSSFSDIDSAQYISVSTSGSFNIPTTNNLGTGADAGFSLQVNAWNSANAPQKVENFKVTKITLIP